MDFICEFIFEIILEGIFGLTVENSKVKTWVKTVVFLLIAETLAGLVILMGVAALQGVGIAEGVICIVIGVVMAAGFLIGAIFGHKWNWKQNDR